MLLQLLFVLLAIVVGARVGGIGLGVFGGFGLAVLTFVFGHEPTAPPIDVMLMIVAVVAAINFDTTGTTHIGKYVLNHSFMLPGLISTFVAVGLGIMVSFFI